MESAAPPARPPSTKGALQTGPKARGAEAPGCGDGLKGGRAALSAQRAAGPRRRGDPHGRMMPVVVVVVGRVSGGALVSEVVSSVVNAVVGGAGFVDVVGAVVVVVTLVVAVGVVVDVIVGVVEGAVVDVVGVVVVVTVVVADVVVGLTVVRSVGLTVVCSVCLVVVCSVGLVVGRSVGLWVVLSVCLSLDFVVVGFVEVLSVAFVVVGFVVVLSVGLAVVGFTVVLSIGLVGVGGATTGRVVDRTVVRSVGFTVAVVEGRSSAAPEVTASARHAKANTQRIAGSRSATSQHWAKKVERPGN